MTKDLKEVRKQTTQISRRKAFQAEETANEEALSECYTQCVQGSVNVVGESWGDNIKQYRVFRSQEGFWHLYATCLTGGF